ncbi:MULTISPECIES: DUF2938 domain-containing protein [Cellvibrio]|uniref:DUF2938 domain-containing protein n=1 Tax=Cellvibrio fibrivorans TaxID=126350 RepID=A0ABU1V2V6_9GAMM|nr:DUF2938 domain-containing protein [Cellvibrio fibrivorans]MDR7091766.1 hypothetical protein [Cellvibrio fibrivorans]
MNSDIFYLAGAIFIGVGATAIMDLWAIVLRRAFNIQSLSFCLVGRWFSHMREGIFRHEKIGAAEKRTGECAIGWVAHYLIGIAYAFVLVLPASGAWLISPSLMPALALGIVTVIFPFFMMQPAFGLGIAAAKAPNPMQARAKSLMSHTVFGAGLYLSALVFSALMRAII